MNPHFVEMLKALRDEGVEHLVIGAHALAAHGYVRATLDIDIWVRPSAENAARVWRALERFRAPLTMRATGTDDRREPGGSVDHKIDHTHPARRGSERHSGATLRGVGGLESEAPRNAKTPAKPGNSGTSQGSTAERLRSESNRRWRICNPLP